MRKFLKILIIKINEVIIFFGSYFLLLFPFVWKWERNNKKAIFLVHGYFNNSNIWAFFGNYLNKKGLGPIYTVNLGSPFHSIEEYVKKLKEEIEKKKGLKEIILIGHSMGGLISWYLALKENIKVKITDIISIGVPFEGTKTAILGFGECAKQMRYKSNFTISLKKDILKENKIRTFNIATTLDQVVIPYQSAILDKKPSFLVEDLGHASMLFSKKIVEKVFIWLTNN
ncbi:MAG: hypothetical protein AMS24_03905 [Chlamydiae bacterium SM23_39]|nr:MAG: hypothetical protein AMS24_03905 [Chlamydiae bacterium SM23_39]